MQTLIGALRKGKDCICGSGQRPAQPAFGFKLIPRIAVKDVHMLSSLFIECIVGGAHANKLRKM